MGNLNPISAEEMAAIEANAEYLGVTLTQLMECAGKAVADKVEETAKKHGFRMEDGVTVYVGTGRNGGDGMVAARHLAAKGFKVFVVLVGVEEKIVDRNARLNWETLKRLNSSISLTIASDSTRIPEPKTPIVVDAMLGIGVRGKLRGCKGFE